MAPRKHSLLEELPAELPEELTEILATSAEVRIERIVSRGQRSPEGFWYDQETDEFVLVMQGRAVVVFEGEAEPVRLGPGDYLIIPRHARHRVEWTDPDETTVWLAVHY